MTVRLFIKNIIATTAKHFGPGIDPRVDFYAYYWLVFHFAYKIKNKINITKKRIDWRG
jgi:hypothetical protein